MHVSGKGASPTLAQLTTENQTLRNTIDGLRRQLDAASSADQHPFDRREREFEDMLDAKSDTIRSLHAKLRGLESAATAARKELAPPGQNDFDRDVLGDELAEECTLLEAQRTQLEDERHHLREEEEQLMGRMKDMEKQMSKERADMVRQRNELNELHRAVLGDMQLAQQQGVVTNRVGSWQQQLHEVAETRKGRR